MSDQTEASKATQVRFAAAGGSGATSAAAASAASSAHSASAPSPSSPSAAASSTSLQSDLRTTQTAAPKANKRIRLASLLAAPDKESESSRRTRPRKEAAVAAAPAADDHARWLALSPAQRCFSDGLALAFSHLTLPAIATAARCCKSWDAAAKRVKSSHLGASVPQLSSDDLASKMTSLAVSPLRHLVRQLSHSWVLSDNVSCPAHHPRSWKGESLQLLQHLPHLTAIHHMLINLADASRSQLPFSFPAQLVAVDLHFGLCESRVRDALAASRCALEALAPCAASLTSVKLTAMECALCDASPLLRLTALTHLTLEKLEIHAYHGSNVLAVIKQIPTLRRLTLQPRREDEDWILDLCEPPHQLQQLEFVDEWDTELTLEVMEALQLLPALAELRSGTYWIWINAVPALAHFAHLRTLDLQFLTSQALTDERDERGFVRASLFLPHLSCGASLSTLLLEDCVFTEAEAEALCLALPHLTSLSLWAGWPSLQPLQHLAQLEEFMLWRTKHTPFHLSLDHLPPLKAMRSLSFVQIFIDEATEAALQPPSALLPKLEMFQSL